MTRIQQQISLAKDEKRRKAAEAEAKVCRAQLATPPSLASVHVQIHTLKKWVLLPAMALSLYPDLLRLNGSYVFNALKIGLTNVAAQGIAVAGFCILAVEALQLGS